MVTLVMIGAGGWGYQHAVTIFKNKKIKPVAFIDKNPVVFEATAERV